MNVLRLASPAKTHGNLHDYLALARFDHCTKHIFIVPGMILAYLLRGVRTDAPVASIALGFIAAFCVASANYVINEWLDRDFDRFHPTKSKRASVQHELRGGLVALEWTALLAVGLGCAFIDSRTMYFIATLFALQGIAYNAAPLRTKNLAYLDVIFESVNNPLRLIVGWAMIDPTTLPPGSLILMYWTGGAFLMAAKRLS
jgi:4-hydroxybenzoate polyprenyltransferase